MRKLTVYIDESGTLPDPKDKVVVVAAVGTESLEKIDLLFRQIRKRISFKRPGGEIKYYTASEKTKTTFFKLLVKENFTLYILCVEKMGRKIIDTPQNYAALCYSLLIDVLSFSPNIKELIFDRHFSNNIDIKTFNLIIKKLIGEDIIITHVDSIKDKRVNIADMIAGAVLANETGKATKFYKMFENKVTSSKRINWKEVKKSLLSTKKLA